MSNVHNSYIYITVHFILKDKTETMKQNGSENQSVLTYMHTHRKNGEEIFLCLPVGCKEVAPYE